MAAWVFEEVAPKGLKKKEAEPSTAEPASIDEAAAASNESRRPRLGDSVDVDAAREQLLTTELVAEVLAHVPCPADAVIWGGYLQNVKSLLPEGEEKGPVAKELWKAFDKWCQSGEGYDQAGNFSAWAEARAEKGDFRTLVGLAVRDGGLRRGRFPEVMDARARFFVSDLLAMRFAEEPYSLEALRQAFCRCLAHVSNSPTFWIAKQKAPWGAR